MSLLPQPGDTALVSLQGDSGLALAKANGALDVVFPVLHGTYGEDGTIQGLLELAGIPYVGAGVLGSAIGMDKDMQKRLLRDAGVPVVRFAALDRSDYVRNPKRARRLADELGYPVFVKPNALGSSIGITKVKRHEDLAAAVDDAFQYDLKVLIEAACEGREFECSVLGNDEPASVAAGRGDRRARSRLLQLRLQVPRPRRRQFQDSRRTSRAPCRGASAPCRSRRSKRWACAA